MSPKTSRIRALSSRHTWVLTFHLLGLCRVRSLNKWACYAPKGRTLQVSFFIKPSFWTHSFIVKHFSTQLPIISLKASHCFASDVLMPNACRASMSPSQWYMHTLVLVWHRWKEVSSLFMCGELPDEWPTSHRAEGEALYMNNNFNCSQRKEDNRSYYAGLFFKYTFSN